VRPSKLLATATKVASPTANAWTLRAPRVTNESTSTSASPVKRNTFDSVTYAPSGSSSTLLTSLKPLARKRKWSCPTCTCSQSSAPYDGTDATGTIARAAASQR
jgi:hypothetical protein